MPFSLQKLCFESYSALSTVWKANWKTFGRTGRVLAATGLLTILNLNRSMRDSISLSNTIPLQPVNTLPICDLLQLYILYCVYIWPAARITCCLF